MGIRAAATFETPRSVANKLNCAAAFLVSRISIRIPSSDISRLVSGANGIIDGPTPMMRRSVTQLAKSISLNDAKYDMAQVTRMNTYQVGATVDQIAQMPLVVARTGPSC